MNTPRANTGFGMTSQRTRTRMIERLREQGIVDEEVLAAIAAVPRHVFVEEALASRAYEDTALPLGYSQTISQPYVVARMIEAAARRP
jgi:protein-L-isoaspartate(D-aspartate) O-methyltransferase